MPITRSVMVSARYRLASRSAPICCFTTRFNLALLDRKTLFGSPHRLSPPEGNHSYAATVGKLDSALVRSSAGLLPPAEVSPVSAIAKERYEFPSRYMSLALTR